MQQSTFVAFRMPVRLWGWNLGVAAAARIRYRRKICARIANDTRISLFDLPIRNQFQNVNQVKQIIHWRRKKILQNTSHQYCRRRFWHHNTIACSRRTIRHRQMGQKLLNDFKNHVLSPILARETWILFTPCLLFFRIGREGLRRLVFRALL